MLIDRMMEKFSPNNGTGCWEWSASRNSNGYGQLAIHGRPQLAHRISWSLANGPIPSGKLICHHCDNVSCINPDHLFLGTHADNSRDMMRKGRGIGQFQFCNRPSIRKGRKPRSTVTVKCQRCGTDSIKRADHASRPGPKFCSAPCANRRD